MANGLQIIGAVSAAFCINPAQRMCIWQPFLMHQASAAVGMT
jgi:hypothetical protein